MSSPLESGRREATRCEARAQRAVTSGHCIITSPPSRLAAWVVVGFVLPPVWNVSFNHVEGNPNAAGRLCAADSSSRSPPRAPYPTSASLSTACRRPGRQRSLDWPADSSFLHTPAFCCVCALAPCALAFRCLQGGEFREVWYPQRSRAALDAKWAESMWGEWPRSSVWIGHVRGSSSNATAGALSKEALLEALDTHEAITGVGSPDVAAAWRDICDNIFKVSAVPSSPEEASDAEKGAACNAHAVSSVLAAWDFDRAALERETTASILARLSAIELVSVSGVPLEPLDTLLGGIARSASGGVAGATAARHAYRTNREEPSLGSGTASSAPSESGHICQIWHRRTATLPLPATKNRA